MSEAKTTVEQMIAQVKALRLQFPGVGLLDCRLAIESAEGDMTRAAAFLAAKGHDRAEDLALRPAPEGYIHSYVHGEGRIGVLVELRCETDFVSRTPAFREVAKGIAMHLVATTPSDLGESIRQPLLLDQPYALDESRTVGEVVRALAVSVGENVHIGKHYVMWVG